MADLVDPFDLPATSAGVPLADPFDEPEPDYSKLGEFNAKGATEGQKWRIALGYLTTPDQKARADIIRKVLPGAMVRVDPSNGRPIVTYQGETGYIDKPGVTLGGILDAVAQIGKFVPAGKFAAGGANLLTQVGRAGAAGAVTSVAEDVAAIPQGSEQGVDPERAAITAAASGAGQALSRPISKGIQWLSGKGIAVWKQMRSNGQAVTPDGTLTDLGRRLATQAGLNPDDITPDLATRLEDAASRATQAGLPDQQVPVATQRQALSQRFRVPLTRGEITGDFAEQSLEENLKRMDVTTKAGQIMRDAESRSTEALRGQSGDTGFGLLATEMDPRGLQLGTPSRVADVSDAGQTLIEATRQQATKARTAYQGAYRSAREAGAALDGRSYREFVSDAERVLKDTLDYDPNLYPKTALLLDNLRGRANWMQAHGQGGPKIPLAKLENLRKLINSQWKAADATDRMGLDVLRNQFDEMVNGALESGRVVGDKTGVQAWKAGRTLFSRFQKLYAPDKAAGQAEQRAGRAVQNWLKSGGTTGDEAIREAIFNKALTQRVLTINGEGSPAHVALKQGVLEYVFRPALKGDGISPRLVVSQFERFFRGAQSEQMRAIYSPREIAAINEFVALARAKIPQTGVVNFSNTGNVLVKAAQQLGQKLGLIGATTGHFETAIALGAVDAGLGVRAASQARSATRGLVPRDRLSVPAVAISGGAVNAVDRDDE